MMRGEEDHTITHVNHTYKYTHRKGREEGGRWGGRARRQAEAGKHAYHRVRSDTDGSEF